MARINKQRGKWIVQIRRKGFPGVYKQFLVLKDARKYARTVESQMERGVFEDYSGARGTTLAPDEFGIVIDSISRNNAYYDQCMLQKGYRAQ